MYHLNAMPLGDAAIVPTFRKLNVRGRTAGAMGELMQKRIGWWWRSRTHGAHWFFTTTLEKRRYPPDAVFVPVYADALEGEGDWV